ncbi:MAG: DUF2029 domain-containing protein, partial [Acidobacteriia bacterium]|nr:DUF2029 domain-containing protein [Terriglobia bacterium]
MMSAGVRRVRADTYVFFLVCFAVILFLGHLPFLALPYYWDEAGQFIPTALDILRSGNWIAHSAMPNAHPPAVAAYLAAVWKVEGFSPMATRTAMLTLAAFAMLAAFLLAIELCKGTRGMPAFLAAALLCASPLFYAQSMLAQLDAPAMLFATVAFLWLLQDRIVLSAGACVVLALVKETGVVVPLVFMGYLAHERRWRDAALFLAPVAVLAGWAVTLRFRTGYWTGNAEFLRYNVLYPLHPVRIAVAFVRRIYYLFFADLRWIGTGAIVWAWRRTAFFQSRAWRVAGLLAGAHVLVLSCTGGATLERYLLPAIPVVLAAMAAGLSMLPQIPRVVCSVALLAGSVAGNFVNPPYPFPYENSPAFTDFVHLHADAAAHLERFYPTSRVFTVWPMTAELSRPELGFVKHRMRTCSLGSLSSPALEQVDWRNVDVFVAFSRTWNPRWSLMRYGWARRFFTQVYGYRPEAGREELKSLVPLRLDAHLERRG